MEKQLFYRLYWLPLAAVTNHHKPVGSKQCIFIILQFWMSAIRKKLTWAAVDMSAGRPPCWWLQRSVCLFWLWRLPVFLSSWTVLHPHTIQEGAPTLSPTNTLASVITSPPLILTQRISDSLPILRVLTISAKSLLPCKAMYYLPQW